MLTKILITVLVIIGAVIYMRYKKSLQLQSMIEPPIRAITVEPELPRQSSPAIKWLAFGVLLLTLVTGSAMLFLNWP